MRPLRRLILAAALTLVGCGGDGPKPPAGPTPAPREDSPSRIDAPVPPGTEAGREVAATAGCLACHRLGDNGNDGPGPDLTAVGARLSTQQIRGALLDPEPPMPSYEALPADDLDALVDYLAALR